MAAIASFQEPYSHLLRGLVEQGVPDGTRGRFPDGDFSVDLLLRGQGGITLRFPAPVASMDDAWNYSIKVLTGKGDRVAVRCAETLFRHVWDRTTPAELAEPGASSTDLAAIILATVLEHNRSFAAWIDGGGHVTRIERAEHPDDPADTLHPDFHRWLADLYKHGKSLSDGPAAGWWASTPADRKALGAGIRIGSGSDPFYRLGPDATEALDVAHQEHLARMGTAGTAAWVVAALMMLIACSGLSWHGFQGYNLQAIPYWMLADFLSGVVALLWLPLGQGLRSPHQRWLFAKGPSAARFTYVGLAIAGMLPCAGPCCLVGLPVGGWIVYLLLDERAKRLLKS